ncbi:MAG: glucose-6-phosphate dehydrogenase assembly protein OpcA [Isosphaeraceae bacterium]|nr:glucose-6-phosphate dehydrogenase assembly protein OpcA [Isosphaeraceae bacterium]
MAARSMLEELPPQTVPLREVEPTIARLVESTDDLVPGPIHRARMSNLVIFSDSRERALAIDAVVPDIIEIHPARVISLIAEPATGDEALVTTVLLRRNIANHRQVSEQITLEARGPAIAHLPFALRELLIGDLPTNLWWAVRTPPALAGPLLHELAEPAQQVLFDSHEWLEPHRGVAALDAWLDRLDRPGDVPARRRTASDLNWRRIRVWRRILAEGLCPTVVPGVLESITEVEIEHGPHAVTQAWAIAGWLSGRLGWTPKTHRVAPGEELSFLMTTRSGAELRLRLIRRPSGPSALQSIRVGCAKAACMPSMCFALDRDDRIALTSDAEGNSPRTTAIGPRELGEVVGRQLSDREPDPIFREAMHHAHRLARLIHV